MKILLVIDHLDPGGAQHQMVTLATGLKRRGHEVACFVYYPEMNHHRPALDDAGVTVYSSEKSSRYSPVVPWRLRQVMRRGFDVSLSYLTTPNIYNVLAAVATDVPTVVSERSALPPGRVDSGVRARYAFYRLADHVVVNSAHQRERLADAFPWMGPKLVTIRNGVDLEQFRPREGARDSGHRLGLLAVGTTSAGKNFLGLIEAVRVHRERFGWTPDVKWVGRKGATDSDLRAFEQAEQLIDRYELRSSWHWLGVRRDVAEIMQSVDALIHPSFFEGLPNVVCEALASGLPVLTSRVCDHPWLVGEGARGLLFEPSDPYDIALVIEEFSSLGKDEIQAMGKRAREFAVAELSVETFVTRYEELFREIA